MAVISSSLLFFAISRSVIVNKPTGLSSAAESLIGSSKYEMNILIVEDDLSIADLLQCALEAEGHQVCNIAHTVMQALEDIRIFDPDYAVVDIHLAEGSLGTDFGARVRKTGRTKIIFSTGNDTVGNLTLVEGDAVMTKPYLMKDVARGIRIVEEVSRSGRTELKLPTNFRLLTNSHFESVA